MDFDCVDGGEEAAHEEHLALARKEVLHSVTDPSSGCISVDLAKDIPQFRPVVADAAASGRDFGRALGHMLGCLSWALSPDNEAASVEFDAADGGRMRRQLVALQGDCSSFAQQLRTEGPVQVALEGDDGTASHQRLQGLAKAFVGLFRRPATPYRLPAAALEPVSQYALVTTDVNDW